MNFNPYVLLFLDDDNSDTELDTYSNSDSGSGSDTDLCSESNFEDEFNNDLNVKEVNLELSDSKSTNRQVCKKRVKFFPSSLKKKPRYNYSSSKKVYDELETLPKSFEDAINKKQNLTLKQILIMMNLHAIPGIAVNLIHDKIQQSVKRKSIKILHEGREFNVSFYYWYNLKRIESLINEMI